MIALHWSDLKLFEVSLKWRFLCLQFLFLNVHIISQWLINAAYGHSIIHSIFIDDKREWVLRHCQSHGLNHSFSRGSIRFACTFQYAPNVLMPLSSCFYKRIDSFFFINRLTPKFLSPFVQIFLAQWSLVNRCPFETLSWSLCYINLFYQIETLKKIW